MYCNAALADRLRTSLCFLATQNAITKVKKVIVIIYCRKADGCCHAGYFSLVYLSSILLLYTQKTDLSIEYKEFFKKLCM